MEPLAHEGMGRLLGLQDRCTPLVLGADAGAKLLPVSELGNGGALKLGRRKLELPPQPLGRDTTQTPFLAVSNEIAVIDGAASHHPRKLVEMLEMARKEAGWQRLLYAPAVEPAEMPLLAYLGVDLFDSLTTELRSVAGFRLEQGDWIPDGKATAAGNLKALAIWLARIRTALEQGLLRELVERTALHNPRVTQLLHHSRDLLVTRGVRRATEIRAGALSFDHPAVVEWRGKLERFVPPAEEMVLLLLPCSARKPYHWSNSHRRFHRTLRSLNNWLALHVVSVTSPLGLVPRELEMLHPAAHYDVGVTGYWDANEREMFGRQLERLRPEHNYKKAVVHAGSASKMLTVLLQERGIEVLDTGAERPASGAGLNALGAACRTALRGVASLSGHNRSRGEATGLAQVQFGELAASLLTAPVQGRWPRLRLGDLANFSPRIGGFALTVQGAAKLVEAGGPVIEAGKFQLRGDLFAAGVTGVRGEFRNGDQVAVEQGGEITAVGIARMAPREMVTMERGLAVEVRNRG